MSLADLSWAGRISKNSGCHSFDRLKKKKTEVRMSQWNKPEGTSGWGVGK